MDIKIVKFDDLSYEELTDLHRSTRESLKEVTELLEPLRKLKTSEITDSEWRIYGKWMFLSKLRRQISERILSMADEVKLQEVL
jgi:hypothetical protein